MTNQIATTLSDLNVFDNYLQGVRKYEGIWLTASLSDRLKFFQDLLDKLTDSVGMIRVALIKDVLKSNFDIGEYRVKSNTIVVNETRLSVRNNKDANSYESVDVINDFYKVALVLYHEARHMEQFFRGLQYDLKTPPKGSYDFESQTESKILVEFARKTPIPELRLRFAHKMRDTFYSAQKKQSAKS
jgi:hypothetical protein